MVLALKALVVSGETAMETSNYDALNKSSTEDLLCVEHWVKHF